MGFSFTSTSFYNRAYGNITRILYNHNYQPPRITPHGGIPMLREDILKIYNELVASCPRFERKGKTMPYTSANGYMFSQLNKDNQIGMRFSKSVQQKYLTEFNTSNFESYGAVLKGYILIPKTMLHSMEQLKYLLNESYDYVMTLKSK